MKEYSVFLSKHPETEDFFGLAADLEAAGIPIYFNVIDHDLEGLEEEAIKDEGSIWDDFDLLIEMQTGDLIDGQYAPVSAKFDGEDFLVWDALKHVEYRNPTRKEAFEVFRNCSAGKTE